MRGIQSMRTKKALVFSAGALLACVATVAGWATPARELGGVVAAGNTSLDLEPVTYDEGTGQVSGILRFHDTNGISSITGTPTFQVLRIDPSNDAISADTIPVPATIDGLTSIRWAFSYTLPSGLKFFGCQVSGTYVNGDRAPKSMDSSIGGFVSVQQFP
jgi:hypothetical protein